MHACILIKKKMKAAYKAVPCCVTIDLFSAQFYKIKQCECLFANNWIAAVTWIPFDLNI